MLFAILAATAIVAPPPLANIWGQFKREGLRLGYISETVDIATGDQGTSETFRYRLRRTTTIIGKAPRITWIDSIDCPAVRPVLSGIRNIAVPRPAPYGLSNDRRPPPMVLDSAGYSLTIPSSDMMGRMSIESATGSSLANWVDGALTALHPCWKTKAP